MIRIGVLTLLIAIGAPIVHADGGPVMVEQYAAKDFRSVKGYAVYLRKLGELSRTFPEFAKVLKAASTRKTWYLIPYPLERVFPNLRGELNEPIVQTEREIFVSTSVMDQYMEVYDSGMLLMRTILIAAQDRMDVSQARLVNAKLFNRETSIPELQDALAESGFGAYFTSDQMLKLREVARIEYLNFLELPLRNAKSLCFDRVSKWRSAAKKFKTIRDWMVVDDREMDLIEYGGESRSYDGPWAGPDYRRQILVDLLSSATGGFYSPFRGGQFHSGLLYTHALSGLLLDSVLFVTCGSHNREFGMKACNVARRELRSIHQAPGYQNTRTLARDSAFAIQSRFQDESEIDFHNLRVFLAEKNFNFARILALTAGDEYALELQGYTGLRVSQIQGLLEKARGWHRVLRNLSAEEKTSQLCDAAVALSADVQALRESVYRSVYPDFGGYEIPKVQ